MKQKLVSEWYENKAHVEEMRAWNKGCLKQWEQSVADRFPQSAKVLDIGCGMGREAFLLSKRGFSVVGLDISEEVIRGARELAKENGIDLPFLCYDGKTLPFDDARFDVTVVWSQTFGLLYGEAYRESFLKECRRVLKPGGLLSFSAHDHAFLAEHYPDYLKERRFFPDASGDIYWESYLPEELTFHARHAGFSTLLCERGAIYKPEDGVILHCLCRKPSDLIVPEQASTGEETNDGLFS